MALAALDALDEARFREAAARARAELACVDDPAARAAVAQLDGIEAWLDGDAAGAAAALERALALDPALGWPDGLFPPAHPLSALRARVATADAPPPPDAPAARDRRRAWPLVVGGGLSAGAATTMWLLADQAAGRAEAAAASGDPGSTAEFAEQTWRARWLRGASGGAGLLAAGLVTAGFTVRW